MKRTVFIITLIAILLLGFFVRVYYLGKESLWLDEGFSVKVAHGTITEAIITSSVDNHPPLYYMLLFSWIRLFGDTEFSVRLLSVIFGMLTLFMVYSITRKLFDLKTALTSVFLTATSILFVWASREARMYSAAMFFSVASMYFFILLLKDSKVKNIVFYLISTSFLCYTHYSGLLVPVAQSIYFISIKLFYRKKTPFTIGKWFAIMTGFLSIMAPWAWVILSRIRESINSLTVISADPTMVFKTSFVTFIFSQITYYTRSNLLGFFLLTMVLFNLIYHRSHGSAKENREVYYQNLYLMFLWFLIPAISFYLLYKFKIIIYAGKYNALMGVPFYILAALGICNIKKRTVRYVLIGIVIFLSFMRLYLYHSTPHKAEWRELARYIDLRAERGDLLLFHSGYMIENVFDYYSTRDDLKRMPFPKHTLEIPISNAEKVRGVMPQDVEGLLLRVGDKKRIWVISAHNRDRDQLIKKELLKGYDQKKYRTYKDIELILLERKMR